MSITEIRNESRKVHVWQCCRDMLTLSKRTVVYTISCRRVLKTMYFVLVLNAHIYPGWRFSQPLFCQSTEPKTRRIVIVSRPDRSPRAVILVICVVPTLLPRQLLEDNDSTPISLANGQCVLNAWFSPVAVPQLLRWARWKDLRSAECTHSCSAA